MANEYFCILCLHDAEELRSQYITPYVINSQEILVIGAELKCDLRNKEQGNTN